MACNDYKSTYGFNPFVQLSASTVNIAEADGVAKISVQYVGPKTSQDLTVNITVTQSSGPTTGVTFPSQTLVIPAGSFSVPANIIIVDDVLKNPDRIFTVTLVSTSNPNIPITTPQTTRAVATIKVAEDDCQYAEGDYVKIGKGKELYGASCYPAGCVNTYAITITKVSANNFQITNFYDDGVTVDFSIDPNSLAITIPSQTKTGSSATYRIVGSTGTGTVNKVVTCNKQLVFYTDVDGTINGNVYQF